MELAKVLEDQAIGGYEVRVVLNESSTKIDEQINILFNERDQDDLLLLYFCGIGVLDENKVTLPLLIQDLPNCARLQSRFPRSKQR
jgi:hypothetical protein